MVEAGEEAAEAGFVDLGGVVEMEELAALGFDEALPDADAAGVGKMVGGEVAGVAAGAFLEFGVALADKGFEVVGEFFLLADEFEFLEGGVGHGELGAGFPGEVVFAGFEVEVMDEHGQGEALKDESDHDDKEGDVDNFLAVGEGGVLVEGEGDGEGGGEGNDAPHAGPGDEDGTAPAEGGGGKGGVMMVPPDANEAVARQDEKETGGDDGEADDGGLKRQDAEAAFGVQATGDVGELQADEDEGKAVDEEDEGVPNGADLNAGGGREAGQAHLGHEQAGGDGGEDAGNAGEFGEDIDAERRHEHDHDRDRGVLHGEAGPETKVAEDQTECDATAPGERKGADGGGEGEMVLDDGGDGELVNNERGGVVDEAFALDDGAEGDGQAEGGDDSGGGDSVGWRDDGTEDEADGPRHADPVVGDGGDEGGGKENEGDGE